MDIFCCDICCLCCYSDSDSDDVTEEQQQGMMRGASVKNVSGNAELLHPLQQAKNNNGETVYAEAYQKALSERKGSNSEGATMLGIIGKNMFGLSAPSKPKTGLAFAQELFTNSQYDIPEGKGSGAPHGHHREWDRSGGSKGLGETIHSHTRDTFGTKSNDKQK